MSKKNGFRGLAGEAWQARGHRRGKVDMGEVPKEDSSQDVNKR